MATGWQEDTLWIPMIPNIAFVRLSTTTTTNFISQSVLKD